MKARLCHKIWLLSQQREARRFWKACQTPESTQLSKLKNYLSANKSTEFGKSHHFDQIPDYPTFTKKVAIQTAESMRPWIDKIANGGRQILTTEPVIAFEETSGTTSMAKLIPYTRGLKTEFEQGLAPWMTALSREYPAAFHGPAYWSLSPATRQKHITSAGIPIGMDDDTSYFNPLTAILLRQIMAVPGTLKNEKDPATFYLQTFEHLFARENLSFVSAWSPAFLLRMDHFLRSEKPSLLERIDKSRIIQRGRKTRLQQLLDNDFTWKTLWPRLQVVSCWTDAQSAIHIPALKNVLGSIAIQGKGLLSTEGIVSIPIRPDLCPALSIRSHFYEFRDPAAAEIKLAHELEQDQTYEVILTTAGGLYRYATGDLVRVNGKCQAVPCFRFVGRKGLQSDLVGEKLTEAQVNRVVVDCLQDYLERLETIFLYPVQTSDGTFGYSLFWESDPKQNLNREMPDLIRQVDDKLKENPWYKQALNLGQLHPLKQQELEAGFGRQLAGWLTSKQRTRDGDLKIPLLFRAGSLSTLLGR